jgi:hypothetical protein
VLRKERSGGNEERISQVEIQIDNHFRRVNLSSDIFSCERVLFCVCVNLALASCFCKFLISVLFSYQPCN